jgi:hypothetical protein
VATEVGTLSESSPKPNASACSRRRSAPRLRPSEPNEVLHEIRSASPRVIVSAPQLLPPKLRRFAVVCGRSSSRGDGICVSVVTSPEDSAAAAVTTLKVEPGG